MLGSLWRAECSGHGSMRRATPDDDREVRERLLDAAESLFYLRGIQTVGMDALREVAGVSLKRIYQLFPKKDDLIVAFLRRRHDRMMHEICEHAATAKGQEAKGLALFDWIDASFKEKDFRGCPWINAYGEFGATNPAIVSEVKRHQRSFRAGVTKILTEAGYTKEVADSIFILADGAIVVAAISMGDTAAEARRAAEVLLRAKGAKA